MGRKVRDEEALARPMNGGEEETRSEHDPCGWNPEPDMATLQPRQVGPPARSPSGCLQAGCLSPGALVSCASRSCHLEKVVPGQDLWKGAGGQGSGGTCLMVRRPHSRSCLPACLQLPFFVSRSDIRISCIPFCIIITFKFSEAACPWCCLQNFLVVIRESVGWGEKSPLLDVSNPK